MRRRRKRPSELTSLIDVLFILLFASLVQARNTIERGEPADTPVVDAGPPDAGPPDAGPPDAGPPDARAGDDGTWSAEDTDRERTRHLSAVVANAVQGVDTFVVEVAATGYVVEIRRWREGALIHRQAVQHRLVTVAPEGDRDELEYPGKTQPWQRICPLVLASLAPPQPDLGQALVVVTVDAPFAKLPLALTRGLALDVAHCPQDAGGVAVLLDLANALPGSELHGIQ